VTFPTERKWEVPHASWHLDAPASPKIPGVLLFAYLAPVPERGGGTVMLAGSHRIVEKFAAGLGATDEGRSADVRRKLNRAEPWLRALWSRDDKVDRVRRFMTEGAMVRGVPLRVMEMTGDHLASVAVPLRHFELHLAAASHAETADQSKRGGPKK
jgi:hypothetical protein